MAVPRIEYGYGKTIDDMIYDLRCTVERQREEIEILKKKNQALNEVIERRGVDLGTF